MKPHTTPALQQTVARKTSPFQLIIEREAQEEKRLHAALELLKKEEGNEERLLLEAEVQFEQKHREELRKELLHRKNLIGKEIIQAEEALAKELQALESLYAKRAPKIVENEVKCALSFFA